jgi:hypothetical protein
MEGNEQLVERLETAAALLERTAGLLEERQRFLSGEVERISATVETTRREEELQLKVEGLERELAELKAAAAQGQIQAQGSAKPLEALRKTLPSGTVDMLAKHGIGESAVDVQALDAAMQGLSLEQRIAVKSQLRRAGALA